ncbi:MAG: DinB family protein [Acidimicrobiia bacterium]|nr:DinB family protein [Acidimicrobiia bacterium]
MERPIRSKAVSERQNLAEFLDYQRATILLKTHGLDSAQAATRSVTPSTLTLAGIVKHLAWVEDHWFQWIFNGVDTIEPWASAPFDQDRDWEFNTARDDDIADTRILYEQACERSRRVYEGAGLDDLSVGMRDNEPFSMRWIMLHMIEETARHAGQADLLREAIDGETGQ